MTINKTFICWNKVTRESICWNKVTQESITHQDAGMRSPENQ